MKSSLKLYNKVHSKQTLNKKFSTALSSHNRTDLTKTWLNRIQSKAHDSYSVESYGKLSSLVDYYSKTAEPIKKSIDWSKWTSNIRTEGLVDKISKKYQEFNEHQYNVDSLASKSAHTSEEYNKYGLFLRYNHDLWMTQYKESLTALNGALELGDIRYVSQKEIYSYTPGALESAAGWRETGYIFRYLPYHENAKRQIIGHQFKLNNSSWMPYYHSVCAWERGFQVNHVLYSF